MPKKKSSDTESLATRKAKPKSKAKTEPKSKTASRPKTVSKLKSDPKRRADPEVKPETKSKTKSKPEPKSSPTETPNEDNKKSETFNDVLDRSIHATIAQMTKGLSPASLANAYWDWVSHLGINQGKQMELSKCALENAAKFLTKSLQENNPNAETKPAGPSDDRRFQDEAWQTYPFNIYKNAFQMNQDWWSHATSNVRGVSKKHQEIVDFMSRQVLDMFSPSNYMLTNPVVLEKTREEAGANLVRGYNNFLEDLANLTNGGEVPGSEKYKVGENIAITPGKVIFQNRLIELIQYEPTTKKVHAEPIFIVPAWIMKYYILDLSEYNSVVRYLVSQGFTVFIISWKNPDSGDRDMGMEDYLNYGVKAALDKVNEVVPDQKVHGVGYCLGGTMLSIFAATLARDDIRKFETLTFLAAQVDFKEAGELTLFIDESQLTFLEDMMWEQGYLDAEQMAGAFQLLRSNDLIWSRILREYMMGERSGMNDIMAWNADPTRMPFLMHTQYLRQLFLNNELADGRYKVDGRPIALSDIRAPLFCVGTQKDHIAPWRSVYKFHNLTDTDVTFLLTSGGHNAGILSEPGHKGRHYQITNHEHEEVFIDPERWIKETPVQDGSWWIEWVKWLKSKSGKLVNPPKMGGPANSVVCDAPGKYVFIKY